MRKEFFGKTKDGQEVFRYVLENARGTVLKLLDYGAVMQSLHLQGRDARTVDVLPGSEDLLFYEESPDFMGSIVGRYANRISGAKFTLEGKEYRLTPAAGEGSPALHSMPHSFTFRLFTAEEGETPDSVVFRLDSPDGDQGFPGNLKFSVTYTLTEDDAVEIRYEGISDQTTLLNPTSHAYFNLDGHETGSILKERLEIPAPFSPYYDEWPCPVGGLRDIRGTAYDFTREKEIGRDIFADDEDLRLNRGYDLAYVEEDGPRPEKIRRVATLKAEKTGLRMDVETDLPAVHLYTGNFLNRPAGKDGAAYGMHAALALETGFIANGINADYHEKAILKAGERFVSTTIYRFSTEG